MRRIIAPEGSKHSLLRASYTPDHLCNALCGPAERLEVVSEELDRNVGSNPSAASTPTGSVATSARPLGDDVGDLRKLQKRSFSGRIDTDRFVKRCARQEPRLHRRRAIVQAKGRTCLAAVRARAVAVAHAILERALHGHPQGTAGVRFACRGRVKGDPIQKAGRRSIRELHR